MSIKNILLVFVLCVLCFQFSEALMAKPSVAGDVYMPDPEFECCQQQNLEYFQENSKQQMGDAQITQEMMAPPEGIDCCQQTKDIQACERCFYRYSSYQRNYDNYEKRYRPGGEFVIGSLICALLFLISLVLIATNKIVQMYRGEGYLGRKLKITFVIVCILSLILFILGFAILFMFG